jgi:phenylpyruvate tautomerase PptA (4-oxalocrotonate tautomerase family)
MPIVRVELLPGRDGVQKEFLARAVTDALNEIAGSSREGVHTIFVDVAAGDWAIGPRLAANAPRKPATGRQPAVVIVERIRIKPGRLDEYVAWRRERLYAYLATCEGFVSSTLLAVGDEYASVEKWASAEARDAAGATQLRDEAAEWLERSAGEDLVGRVVDVFGAAG